MIHYLQNFLNDRLTNEIAIKNKVNGIYTEITNNSSFPYIYLGDFKSSDYSTKEIKAYEIYFRVHLYFRDKNKSLMLNISDKIKEILDVKTEYPIVFIKFIEENLKIHNDGITKQITLIFRSILVKGERNV